MNLTLDVTVLLLLNLAIAIYFIEDERKKYEYYSIFLLILSSVAVLSGFLRLIPLPLGLTFSFLIPISSGVVFGPLFGFLVGQTSIFASGLFLGGIGSWLPYQALLMGTIAFYAGFFRPKGKLLFLYIFLTSFLYGYFMTVSFWPIAMMNVETPKGFSDRVETFHALYISSSMIWDLTRALGNLLIFSIFFESAKELMKRGKSRLAIG